MGVAVRYRPGMTGFHRQRRRTRGPRGTGTGEARPPAQDGMPTPADVAAKRRPPTLDGEADPDGDPVEAANTSATMATADPEDLIAPVPEVVDEPPANDRDTERGLRGLVGSGSSQVSVSAAARARDAARPTDEDLGRAERELTIVRRKWVPREPFRPGGHGRR